MNTPDHFYKALITNSLSDVYLEFNFDADLVQIINDGVGKIRVCTRGIKVDGTCPEVYPGEMLTLPKTAGQRLAIMVGLGSDGVASNFRVYAFR